MDTWSFSMLPFTYHTPTQKSKRTKIPKSSNLPSPRTIRHQMVKFKSIKHVKKFPSSGYLLSKFHITNRLILSSLSNVKIPTRKLIKSLSKFHHLICNLINQLHNRSHNTFINHPIMWLYSNLISNKSSHQIHHCTINQFYNDPYHC